MRDWAKALLAGIGLAAAVLLMQWMLGLGLVGEPVPAPTVVAGRVP